MGSFNWAKLQNYNLWVLVSSLALLLLQNAGVGITAQSWNQLISGFLGLMVLLGLVNSPASVMMLLAYRLKYGGSSSFTFHWSALLNYAFLVALVAYVPQVLTTFNIAINLVFYNQVALYVLAILGALGIITGAPASALPQIDRLIGTLQEHGLVLSAPEFERAEFDAGAIKTGTLQPLTDKKSQRYQSG